MSEISSVLKDRESTHGDFTARSLLSQELKMRMVLAKGWESLSYSQRESLEMIASKISRILNGNTDEVDHWRDIAGYAQLVVNILEEEERTE